MEQKIYCIIILGNTLYWTAYMIMMVADVLVLNRCQAICNHHVGLTNMQREHVTQYAYTQC